MTTVKLIILRLFNLSFGRIPICARLLKKILIIILIKNRAEKYVASSRYFDLKKFENARERN